MFHYVYFMGITTYLEIYEIYVYTLLRRVTHQYVVEVLNILRMHVIPKNDFFIISLPLFVDIVATTTNLQRVKI